MLGRSCLLERFSWLEAEDVVVAYAGTFTWYLLHDVDTAPGVCSCICLRYADPLLFLEDAFGSRRRANRQTWWFGYFVDESNHSLFGEISVSVLQQRY